MSAAPPTAKQLRYLRQLALRAGQTFTPPRTRAQASSEIRRLRAVRGSGMTLAELAAENEARSLAGDVPLRDEAIDRDVDIAAEAR